MEQELKNIVKPLFWSTNTLNLGIPIVLILSIVLSCTELGEYLFSLIEQLINLIYFDNICMEILILSIFTTVITIIDFQVSDAHSSPISFIVGCLSITLTAIYLATFILTIAIEYGNFLV